MQHVVSRGGGGCGNHINQFPSFCSLLLLLFPFVSLAGGGRNSGNDGLLLLLRLLLRQAKGPIITATEKEFEIYCATYTHTQRDSSPPPPRKRCHKNISQIVCGCEERDKRTSTKKVSLQGQAAETFFTSDVWEERR